VLYQDPIIRRAIEPIAEVINGASRFLEPQLLMAALGLEAMGHYRDPNRKPHARLHCQVQRCVEATNVDWSVIGPNEGIAQAIANTNNDLKHPDRPNRPDHLQLSLITRLSLAIMRLQVLDLLRLPDMSKGFHARGCATEVIRAFDLNGVTIDANGSLHHAIKGALGKQVPLRSSQVNGDATVCRGCPCWWHVKCE
jgi:hypothetical protein